MIPARFDPDALAFEVGCIRLAELAPLVDGRAPAAEPPAVATDGGACRVIWPLDGGERFELDVAASGGEIELACRLCGFAGERRLASLGLRFGAFAFGECPDAIAILGWRSSQGRASDAGQRPQPPAGAAAGVPRPAMTRPAPSARRTRAPSPRSR